MRFPANIANTVAGKLSMVCISIHSLALEKKYY